MTCCANPYSINPQNHCAALNTAQWIHCFWQCLENAWQLLENAWQMPGKCLTNA
ncbi:hypothetical protein PTTG_27792 [Puccinia triticina 1-1 BBBD Race 1]|uniref:Uncharacterized protein n=1 Tax=Puccinia triticina (isolate 1-1 / race 1 (BBBD)) TaxID=630390 RepID=A0A180GGW1_PUCT1|nr:hypothetical protein PTTG_27792 [Puccinia triticina 1-1 BBBD Race 1]